MHSLPGNNSPASFSTAVPTDEGFGPYDLIITTWNMDCVSRLSISAGFQYSNAGLSFSLGPQVFCLTLTSTEYVQGNNDDCGHLTRIHDFHSGVVFMMVYDMRVHTVGGLS